jgi:hypothetical protein
MEKVMNILFGAAVGGIVGAIVLISGTTVTERLLDPDLLFLVTLPSAITGAVVTIMN